MDTDREFLELDAQPAKPAHPVGIADPFTYIIQHLNSSPRNLSKDECIHMIKELRDRYNQPKHCASCAYEYGPPGSDWCYMFRKKPAGRCAKYRPDQQVEKDPTVGEVQNPG